MRRLLILTLLTLVVAACKTGEKLIGTWRGSVNGASITLEFRKDMTYTTQLAAERNGGVTSTGTYKVDGNSVTLHPESASNAEGSVPSGGDMRYSITWRGDNAMKMGNMRDSMELTKEQ